MKKIFWFLHQINFFESKTIKPFLEILFYIDVNYHYQPKYLNIFKWMKLFCKTFEALKISSV